MKWEAEFPPGTPVRVRQATWRRGLSLEAVVVGVVVEWQSLPTGSWYVHGRKDRLWLERLKLRRADGELTLIVIDDSTHLARLEPSTH